MIPRITVRCGIGYDVHAFGPKRKLILGGIRIPSLLGLEGHSDADVVLHAICDALLGAAALGDIGRHFPNTHKRYKDISSLLLLQAVGDLLKRRGYAIGNIDATILLEKPKLSPYVTRMRKAIAGRLKIKSTQVSIKATTNESLGFVGRGQGCAALALAAIFPSTEKTGARIHR
ncbi:MAG TPA: 2-C-methyl-D-erythritol 2,4-cyclodiphosphate synthase [Bacteroidota bacterium]|nr:2-C-methyl-D-erythritol 2,4-cyclodiphosphate synthase [Bacteroidota bacterium]